MAKKRPKANREEPAGELPAGVGLRKRLRGHDAAVMRMAWSPDGRWLASPSEDKTIRIWDVATGETARVLTGHEGTVYSVAWSPDGRRLASASSDKTVRLWDPHTGQQQRSLTGHSGTAICVAWSPDGHTLASASFDTTVRLWNAESGDEQRVLSGHSGRVNCVVWSSDGRRLASASDDMTVRVWDVQRGESLQVLEGHTDSVNHVAWSPDGQWLASAGVDQSVRIWDLADGRCEVELEGHTTYIQCVAFSPDGRLLASNHCLYFENFRLWRCDTWEPVAVWTEPASGDWPPGVAFHPHQPLLATPGEMDEAICLWELDYAALGLEPVDKGLESANEGSEAVADVVRVRSDASVSHEIGYESGESDRKTSAVHHTTAKIVLVGDSGVGKTGLGWRLAHGEFKEHPSTHGQQFWVLEQLSARRDDGTQCEAILWDLAGQPDYRLTHALFLDDADLALILFDPTDARDPLHGVEFWIKQLTIAQQVGRDDSSAAEPLPMILVGGRCDRGDPRLTDDELHAYCKQRGIAGRCVMTSAKAEQNLEELLRRMREQVVWEQKTKVVTTQTFKRIKDYVLGLKEGEEFAGVLVELAELRRRLEQLDADGEWSFRDEELRTAVGHLENYGYVRLLRTSTGATRVLLQPELLNNLAASFVLEARRNPKGLGALEETPLLAGKYAFREVVHLDPDDRDMLLDAAALAFLEHNVAFRETDPLRDESFLVFPELINLKKPPRPLNVPIEEGPAYTVAGAVENVYASLVVLLGYTNTFTRTDQWHNHARYEVSDGRVCGFRQSTGAEGELELVLYFGHDALPPQRMLFQGLFESFLQQRRKLTVERFDPVACHECGQPLSRDVQRSRRQAGKDFACCNECGERLSLPPGDDPLQLSPDARQDVEQQRQTAHRRTVFEQAVFQLQNYVSERESRPECFISYAWGNPEHERWVRTRFATDLRKAGLRVLLDVRENAEPGRSIVTFVERIPECDYVLAIGTPLYRRKYVERLESTGRVVGTEIRLIGERLIRDPEGARIKPLLLDGEAKDSMPPLMLGLVHADFRDETSYFATTYDLMLYLYGISHDDPAVSDWRSRLGHDRSFQDS